MSTFGSNSSEIQLNIGDESLSPSFLFFSFLESHRFFREITIAVIGWEDLIRYLVILK